MLSLYRKTNIECSRLITRNYSTSFSMGILAFEKKYRDPIYAIYGFVRYADEIVDTFHNFNKKLLLEEFKRDTYLALERGISLNPVLDAFQDTVKRFQIERSLIDAFLRSMEMDLEEINYAEENYNEYIYGSAEVVGLMCLRVFCEGSDELFEKLKMPARHLGAAFQKVNFLRDIKDDFLDRGRTYFPNVDLGLALNDVAKKAIEEDIQRDFDLAYAGIVQLPKGCRNGVLTAYRFYLNLFRKIRKVAPKAILQTRVRVPNYEKAALLIMALMSNRLNWL
ncbi:MAG: phytoene/squalene synthase family protein [Bacteroidia bacterium]